MVCVKCFEGCGEVSKGAYKFEDLGRMCVRYWSFVVAIKADW
jgi:hypothetical protein